MSATNRKPDARCPLNRLPPSQQDAVAEFAASHSLTQTVRWLNDPARLAPSPADPNDRPDPDQPPCLSLSRSALSNWLADYRTRHQIAENRAAITALLEHAASRKTVVDPDQLRQAGDYFFAAIALCNQDPNLWIRIQREILQCRRLDFDITKNQLRPKPPLPPPIRPG